MNYLIIALRLIHILGGIFWVGGAVLLFFFITPAIGASGEAGQKFIGQLMGRTRLVSIMSAAAGANVLAGAFLYWIDSDGFTSAWLRSGPGIGFGLGAVFALIGFAVGLMVGGANRQMAALGAQVKGQPTPEQASQMAAIRSRLATLGPINTWSLIIAALFMATSRYFSF